MQRVFFLALTVLMLGRVATADGLQPPKAAGALADPAEKTAELLTQQIEKHTAAWAESTDKLEKALARYNPASVIDLKPEGAVLESIRERAELLRKNGASLLKLYAEWKDLTEALVDWVKEAPPHYRRAAEAMRQQADKASFMEVKQQFLDAAETFDLLATNAEERVKALKLDKDSKDLMAIVRDQNQFLGAFVQQLDRLPKLPGGDDGRSRRMLELLKNHAQKTEEFDKNLGAFRDKLRAARVGAPAAPSK